MKLSHKKVIPFLIYIITGILICGVLWQHRKAYFSQTLTTECKSYDNVTDIWEGFSLSAGTYTIDLEVEPDGTVPTALFQVYSKAYGPILTVPVNNLKDSFQCQFNLERASDQIFFRVVYEGYDGSETERINTTSMTLYSDHPLCTDTQFGIILFLLVYLTGGFFYFGGKKPEKANLYGMMIGLAVLFSSYPLMKGYLIGGHDLTFHMSRIEGIKDALLSGQFPVRVHPTYNAGHGYATAALYPELFLYIPAILRVMGVSMNASVAFFSFLINLSTALIMYYAIKSVTKSSYYATLASVLYTLSLYRFSCMHLRAAWGEVLALCFLPLVISGIYHIFFGDPGKWGQLVIGATGIFQSHIISTLLTAFLAVCLGLIFMRALWTDRRWLVLLKSIAMIVLLNLWFLIPFLDFYRLDLTLKHAKNIFHEHVVIPAQLFCLFGDNIGVSNPQEMGIQWEMSITPGILIGICIFCCLIYFLYSKKEEDRFARTLFWFGMGCMVCSTSLIPWKYLEDISLINLLTSTIQFPWRLLGETTVCSVMAAAMAGARQYPDSAKENEKKLLLIVMTCLGIIGCIPLGSNLLEEEGALILGVQSVIPDLGYNQEYLLYETDAESLKANQYATSGDGVQVTEYYKNSTAVSVHYTSDADGWIEVPLLWYPGYQAVDSETGKELPLLDGNNHVIRVTVPKAAAGTFHVSYTGRTRYHVAEAITLLTLLGGAGNLIWRRRRQRLWPAAGKK